MKILVACRTLKSMGGSQTFNFTLASELKKQGHETEYFTIYPGFISNKLEAAGIPFASKTCYDLIIASQIRTITELKKRKISGPVVQICHGAVTPGEQPHPKAECYIAISEEVRQHLESTGIDAPVILNGVDCERFKPHTTISNRINTIVSLVQTDEANALVEKAARILKIKVIRMNKYQDNIWETEKEINKADLVISLGRGCFEAMACGRPVVVFDKRRYQEQFADGYMAPEDFENFVKNNCSGRFSRKKMNLIDLVQEILKYDPRHGESLRKIAIEKLNIENQAKRIIEACKPVMENFDYPGTIDVVYPLGTGSKWNNNELRYSIRSFKKYFKNLRNIVIVGVKPDWLQGVIHIPFPDKKGVHKDGRMLQKVAMACKDQRVSDNFIFCSDDSFLNQPLTFEDFKGWHEGPMLYDAEKELDIHRSVGRRKQDMKPAAWFDFMYATGRELKSRGLPDNNYDRAHAPQPVNKEEFLKVLREWDLVNNRYTCKNLYLNSSELFPGENINDKNGKIYNLLSYSELQTYLKDKIIFNINDNGLNDTVKAYLEEKFSEPTEFEMLTTCLKIDNKPVLV